MARNYAGSGDRAGSGQRSFAQVPAANIPRSTFNRSHGHKTAFDAGLLIPIFCDEVLPGDTMNMSATLFARLATPFKPVMDQMWLDTHWFFVPYRLVWDNFQKFMGEQTDPGDSTSFSIPQISTGGNTWGSTTTTIKLGDYFGVPVSAPLVCNALPFRSYHLIWNEWFRDENLQDSVFMSKSDVTDSGAQSGNYHLPLRRGKRHDYFTSCLPWPQKSDLGAVTLPLGTTAPVIGDGVTDNPIFDVGGQTGKLQTEGATGDIFLDTVTNAGDALWDTTALVADLTNATAATINELRQAFQVQKLYERDARGGTRYTEIVRSHFSVTSDDARLQRPEYLGGNSVPVNINPVAWTAEVGAGQQVGDLSGFGIAAGSNSWVKSFTEHGTIIGLASVRADLHYQQGLHRMWSRESRLDFYWPSLAHLGEQAVLNQEIFYQGAGGGSEDTEVFGYQSRYDEYRYKPSFTTGVMRSDHILSTDIWHLGQDFLALPALNASFIEENPPIDRISAVPAEHHFIMDSYFSYKCARPMPTYSVPGLIDHF